MHGTLGAVDYADQNGIGGQRLAEKFRVQVPIILAATATLQFLYARWIFDGVQMPANVYSSVWIALGANLAGLISYRRLRLYPGTRRLAFIIPSFTLGWSLAAVCIVALRLDYSASQLALGLVSALLLALLINAWSRRPDTRSFLLVPSPRVDTLVRELPGLNYELCKRPEDIRRAEGVIIADLHHDFAPEWEIAIAEAAVQGNPVYHVKQIGESLTGRVQVEHLSENLLGTLAPDETYAFVKNIVERVFALVVLLASLPILAIACLAIKIDSPGPAIFRQTRVGFRGEKFTIHKLRTMQNGNRTGRREDDITLENDPRITRLGRFLRSTRVDEIPQLWNVLRGEMSLIGPRPETVQLSEWYAETIDFYVYRHIVLPGITGWAQVKQGHVASTDDVLRKLQYDFYYIKNFSLWLDIVIILRTIKVMILKLGAR